MGGRKGLVFLIVAAFTISALAPVDAGAAVLGGAADSTLAREPILRPDDLGTAEIDGLEYADPTEGLSLVDPPEADSFGGAELTYPLIIPQGRGLTPDVDLTYSSNGDNGWLGVGWDLDVGAVEVDTSFGAPHFHATKESESYTLDGDLLVPNARSDAWVDRVAGSRRDYSRQVETEYEEIIRHEVAPGGPKNYFWEVRDKEGNVRWYGGYPDAGGPEPTPLLDGSGTPLTIDRSAIVTDGNGNAARWLLSAERDVGVNVIRYHYREVDYAPSNGAWTPTTSCTPSSTVCARHTYLDRIDYTEASQSTGLSPDPAYQIHLLLDSEVDPSAPARLDPVVDATGGYVDALPDRLARIEVVYGAPAGGAPRTYDQSVVEYNLDYTTGPFGKSLLSTITQGTGSDAVTHQFDYYDEVTSSSGAYDGFAAPTDWSTSDDLESRLLLDTVAEVGALGASESNSGEGHAYIGFNPVVPQKVGSFGGSIQVGGGRTEAFAEWIDLNGDNLPDKVFRDHKDNNKIKFRLNGHGPSGPGDFGSKTPPSNHSLPGLSGEANINFQLSVEAYVVVTAAFGLGADFAIGDAYFTDVNADGLPDFITGGKVFFNHLVGGIPTFTEDSTATQVPLPVNTNTPTIDSSRIDDAEADLAAQSPLVDTVRRWVAPYAGTVSIDADVTFTPFDTSVDGVRVAIQHNNTELDSAVFDTANETDFGADIVRTVAAGDAIYFRVGSVNDGAGDQVDWAPTITYTSIPGAPTPIPVDVNGLSQTTFSASDDFTLAGRPDTNVVMPFQGRVRFEATIDKAATTDDVELVVEHNGTPVAISNSIVSAAFDSVNGPDSPRSLAVEFDVAGPVVADATDPSSSTQDTVEAYLGVDSPVDLTAIDWGGSLHYVSGIDGEGDPLVVVDGDGNPSIVVDFAPEIDQYPNVSPAEVAVPYTGSGGPFDAVIALDRQSTNGAAVGQARVIIKSSSGVVFEQSFGLDFRSASSQTAVIDTNFSPAANTDYWVEVIIRDPAVSGESMQLVDFSWRPNGGNADGSDDVSVPEARLRYTGQQGIFPLAYRGWGVAGYTAADSLATAPIVESAFEIDTDGADFDPANAPDDFDDIGDAADPATDPSYAYTPFAAAPTAEGQPADPAPLPGALWRGPRDNLSADATDMRSSRYGTDSVELSGPVGGGGRAVTRLGITAPTAALAFGIGPLGASFGIGPSFGIIDYEDLNGDGYPDVISAGHVSYTDQRGAFRPSTPIGEAAVTNQDLTFSVTAGLTSGLVDIKANAKGKTNATAGSAAGKGDEANDSGGGIGIGAEVNASWTSPNASGPADSPAVSGSVSGGTTDPASTFSAQAAATPDDPSGGTAPIQQAFADVNGDGLPDRVFTTPLGVFAHYNLGYGFTDASVALTNGGFESMESYAGAFSLGFSTPWAEFSGGVSLNWNFDLARYSWRDVNGDGILDQLHKINNSSPPTVSFGTGSGFLPPVVYGTMESAEATAGIDTGQQIAFDRSNSIGGGFDFTIYVGPLCLVACYLVINPGASYQNSVSSTQVDLQDVNGDGYADSVSTIADQTLTVRLNNHGRTNLLRTVHNPLGGTIDLAYGRDGNTTDHADSIWALTRVDVNDGRPGDGADVQSTTYEYDGLLYDIPHRASLGYSSIVERELDTTVTSETVLRITERQFRNDTVFSAGLPVAVELQDAAGNGIRRAELSWQFRDVRNVSPDFEVTEPVALVSTGSLGDLTSTASRGRSVAPLLVRSDERWLDGAGATAKVSTTTFEYDGLGNVLVQTDFGEPDDPDDDAVAAFAYTNCVDASSIGCATATPASPSPLSSPLVCSTWVSLPAVFTVTNGKTGADEVVYRHRDGSADLCDNASVSRLLETVDDTTTAVTDLRYDAFGAYDRIVYPAGADGNRYAVQYVYDSDRNSDIAQVTDYDFDVAGTAAFLSTGSTAGAVRVGLTSSATFDPLADRIARRTDANGNNTDYTYDGLGRIASISSPRPADTAPLITYEYAPAAAGYAYAVAHHLDVFADDPADTIDTVTFVDGIGRVTQTKRDARLFQGVGVAPGDGRTVSGATNFDALGRAVEQYLPTADTAAKTTYDGTTPSGPVTTTQYSLTDKPTRIVEPGTRVTTVAYDYGKIDPAGPTLFTSTMTAPNDRATITFTDNRDTIHAIDDQPSGLSPLRTSYEYDGFAQLLEVTDTANNVTTYSYDLLGNRLTTDTPDGGLAEFGYDAEGKLVSKVTPNLRADGTEIRYGYELGQLVSIDYPDGTPDVSYTYGAMGAPTNGAGRVVSTEDGSQILTNEYAPSGALVRQVAEMKVHRWDNPGVDRSELRWTTEWEYDGLGRLMSMVYPDSERLTYDYDSGGLVQQIDGEEDGYEVVPVLDANGDPVLDEFGNPTFQQVPRTWTYAYLNDRQYDEQLRRRFDEYGNGANTELTFETNTGWLARQQTFSPNRNTDDPLYEEIQDLQYTYDSVGNPLTYRNDMPPPLPSLYSGATDQQYTYDPYERVIGGTGAYERSSNRTRYYEFEISYDRHGNVVHKDQFDAIDTGKKDLVQKKTTYDFDRVYAQPAPHQATSVGRDDYHYDDNGNFLGITDRRGKWVRQVTWDASDRMRTVTDGPATTDYTYDGAGRRTIERGPAGETAFVNPWFTLRNTNEIFKHIWAGDDRIATQRDDGGNEEVKRYFLHKDLQGSTNIITDYRGDTFQHHEYFPTGQVWINEHNTVFRTPYQYAGGYVDEVREIISIGARWYDQNREFFYSPDPILVDDGEALLDEPGLAPAYSYAGANPVTNVDPSGRRFFTAHSSNQVIAADKKVRATIVKNPSFGVEALAQLDKQLPRGLANLVVSQERSERYQALAEALETNPLVEINLSDGTVKIGAPYGKRLKLGGNEKADVDSTATGGAVDDDDGAGGDTGAAADDGTPVAAQQPPPVGGTDAAAPAAPPDSGAADADGANGGDFADDASSQDASAQAVTTGRDTRSGD